MSTPVPARRCRIIVSNCSAVYGENTNLSGLHFIARSPGRCSSIMFTPFAIPSSTSRDPGVEAHSNSSVSGPALRCVPVCVCMCVDVVCHYRHIGKERRLKKKKKRNNILNRPSISSITTSAMARCATPFRCNNLHRKRFFAFASVVHKLE